MPGSGTQYGRADYVLTVVCSWPRTVSAAFIKNLRNLKTEEYCLDILRSHSNSSWLQGRCNRHTHTHIHIHMDRLTTVTLCACALRVNDLSKYREYLKCKEECDKRTREFYEMEKLEVLTITVTDNLVRVT